MGLSGRIIAIVAACVALSACSTLSPRQAPKASAVYTIDEVGKITHAEKPACKSITVDVTSAGAGYGSARMIYTRNPHQLESFVYHKWADTPASMLQGVLVSALEKGGRFEAVLSRSAAQPLRLSAELLELDQQFSGSDSRLVLEVRMHLRAGDEVIASKVFREEEEAGSGPETGVTAANRAAARLTEEMTAWLDESLPKAKQACQ